MSFVGIKQFNKLVERVNALELEVRALKGYSQPEPEAEQPDPDEDDIPTIEEAVTGPSLEGPSLYDYLDDQTAGLLYANDYDVPKIQAADDKELIAISGIGQATVTKIRLALEGVY